MRCYEDTQVAHDERISDRANTPNFASLCIGEMIHRVWHVNVCFLAQSYQTHSPEAKSLLFFHYVVQAADVRQNLYHKLVAAVKSQLGLSRPAYTGGCPGDTELISMETRSC